jgi:hypothetical protein
MAPVDWPGLWAIESSSQAQIEKTGETGEEALAGATLIAGARVGVSALCIERNAREVTVAVTLACSRQRPNHVCRGREGRSSIGSSAAPRAVIVSSLARRGIYLSTTLRRSSKARGHTTSTLTSLVQAKIGYREWMRPI